MPKFMLDGQEYCGGSGGETVVELTQEEYDALGDVVNSDNKTYYITDADDQYDAGSVIFDNSENGMNANNVQSAINEINTDITNNHQIKTYSSMEQLGLSGSITLTDLINAMPQNSRYIASNSTSANNYVSDVPESFGTLDVVKAANDDAYIYATFIKTNSGNSFVMYGCRYRIVDDDIGWSDWERITQCLPLTGGEMTGNILWGARDVELKHSSGNTANRTMVRGGFTYNDGASLYLNGKDRSTEMGEFNLLACDGTNSKSLIGKPDGTFTWGGLNIGTGYNIMSGWVEITPTEANAPTKKTVTFPRTFVTNPFVVACPMGGEGGRKVLGCSVNNFTTTGFDVYLTRTDTTSTGVSWIAIGI